MYNAYTTTITVNQIYLVTKKRYKIKSRKKCLCMYNSEKQNKNTVFSKKRQPFFPFLVKNIPLRV